MSFFSDVLAVLVLEWIIPVKLNKNFILIESEIDLVRVDKTLSELWHLRGNTDRPVSREEYEKEAKETAYIAINTIQKLQRRISELELENDQLKGVNKFS